MADPKCLIILLICVVYAAGAILVFEEDEARCKTDDCQNLYTWLVSRLNTSVDRCENIVSYTCDRQDASNMNQYIKHQHSNALKEIENLFENRIAQTKYRSFDIEKILYHQCLRLGDGESQEGTRDAEDKYKFLKLQFKAASDDVAWQKIDDELSKAGFGRAFFNVRVIRNPENNFNNIIMIEPPSLHLISNTIEFLNRMKFSANPGQYQPRHEKHFFLYKFLQTRSDSIMAFLNLLLKAATKADYMDLNIINGNETSIFKWHRTFNKNAENVTYINWSGILVETFREVGININENEPLVIKNEMYFAYLLKTLEDNPNNVIGTSIITLALMSNLRYIDWKLAVSHLYVKKTDFCLHETKLYGASYAMLRNIEDNRNRYTVGKLHEVLSNVISSMKSEIYKAHSLSFKRESYLLSEIDLITSHVYKHVWTDDLISNYYDEFSFTDSYITNIMTYRKLIRRKELVHLKQQTGQSKYLPFSLLDLNDPANRFTINTMFLDFLYGAKELPKQIYYAQYGARIASTLYALLNENKVKDVTFYYNAPLKAYPTYSKNKLECIESETRLNDVYMRNDAITHLYGLRIAYAAMTDNDSNDVNYLEHHKKALFPKQNLHDMKQIFYLSYVQSYCKENEAAIDIAVRHSKIFESDFPECTTIKTKCGSNAFEHMDKSAFLVNV